MLLSASPRIGAFHDMVIEVEVLVTVLTKIELVQELLRRYFVIY